MTENNPEDKEKGFFPCINKCLTCINQLFPYIIIALISLSLIGWIYCSSAIIDSYWIPIHKSNAEILGVFGDFFGGTLNPILTLIALIFLIKSYKMQKEEFKALCKANEELSQTNKEQVALLKTQNKQDLTFKMLDKWEALLRDVKHHDGRLYFISRFWEIQNSYMEFIERIKRVNTYNYSEFIQEQLRSIINLRDKINNMKEFLLFLNDFKTLWETEKIDKEIAKQLFSTRFEEYFISFRKTSYYLKRMKKCLDKYPEPLDKITKQKDLFEQHFQDLIIFYKANLKS